MDVHISTSKYLLPASRGFNLMTFMPIWAAY